MGSLIKFHPLFFRSSPPSPPSFIFVYEERLHDVRLWKIFNDSISVPSRHPFDSSCHVHPPPPLFPLSPPSAPFYFAIFARIHRTMPRNKTRPPLIRITPENPRNCTVAPVLPEREKMVLKSVSGISFRFTIFPPILLASLIHRCPLRIDIPAP